MGALPSKESQESPASFHIAHCGHAVISLLPISEHFFPSATSLAFRQLYECRSRQSAKYNYCFYTATTQPAHEFLGKHIIFEDPARVKRPRPCLLTCNSKDDDGDDDSSINKTDEEEERTEQKAKGVQAMTSAATSELMVTKIDEKNFGKFFGEVSGPYQLCAEDKEPDVCVQSSSGASCFGRSTNSVPMEVSGGNAKKTSAPTTTTTSNAMLPQASGVTEQRTGRKGSAKEEEEEEEGEEWLKGCCFNSPEELYSAVIMKEPHVVTTNKEMCAVYAEELAWLEARAIMRAYRKQKQTPPPPPPPQQQPQQQAAEDEAKMRSDIESSAESGPSRLVSEEEFARAEKVPAPMIFLRPGSQAIITRISYEEEEAQRQAYYTANGIQPTEPPSSLVGPHSLEKVAPGQRGDTHAREERCVHIPTLGVAMPPHEGPCTAPPSRHYRFEEDDTYKDGRVHLVAEDGVLYLFAYNPNCNKAAAAAIARGGSGDGQVDESANAKRGQSNPPAHVDADDDKHAEGGEGVAADSDQENERDTKSPGRSTMQSTAIFREPDLSTPLGGGLVRQRSSLYTTTSSFGGVEDVMDGFDGGAAGTDGRRRSNAHKTSSSVMKQDETALQDGVYARKSRSNGGGTAATDAIAAVAGAFMSTSSTTEEEEEEEECKTAMSENEDYHDPGSEAAAVAAKAVQRLELHTSRRFLLPICPVRVVGINSMVEAKCRGTAAFRGYDNDPEEDDYIEHHLAVRPPVMRMQSYVDAAVGDKILSRAILLNSQIYENLCFAAGLPGCLVRSSWSLNTLSIIPYLQICREMRFRVRAAAAEVEHGYQALRRAIKGTSGDLDNYICSATKLYRVLDEATFAWRCCKCYSIEVDVPRCLTNLAEQLVTDPEDVGTMDALPSIDKGTLRELERRLRFPPYPAEYDAPLTVRGNRTLVRVSSGAHRRFFHLMSVATAPFSASQFMKPGDISQYDYGGTVSLHHVCTLKSAQGAESRAEAQDKKGAKQPQPTAGQCCGNIPSADSVQVMGPPRCMDDLLRRYARGWRSVPSPAFPAATHAAAQKEVRNGHNESSASQKDEKGEENGEAPVMVFVVVDSSSASPGGSTEHQKRLLDYAVKGDAFPPERSGNNSKEEDGGGASSTLAANKSITTAHEHQYVYPHGTYIDGDLVVYNVMHGVWEPLAAYHRRLQVLQRCGSSRDTSASVTSPQEASADSVTRDDEESWMYDDARLEDILLAWVKRKLQSAALNNKLDPGWVRDHNNNIVKEGRYYIWGFEHDGQRFFYGLIPRFAKDKRRMRKAGALLASASSGTGAGRGAVVSSPTAIATGSNSMADVNSSTAAALATSAPSAVSAITSPTTTNAPGGGGGGAGAAGGRQKRKKSTTAAAASADVVKATMSTAKTAAASTGEESTTAAVEASSKSAPSTAAASTQVGGGAQIDEKGAGAATGTFTASAIPSHAPSSASAAMTTMSNTTGKLTTATQGAGLRGGGLQASQRQRGGRGRGGGRGGDTGGSGYFSQAPSHLQQPSNSRATSPAIPQPRNRGGGGGQQTFAGSQRYQGHLQQQRGFSPPSYGGGHQLPLYYSNPQHRHMQQQQPQQAPMMMMMPGPYGPGGSSFPPDPMPMPMPPQSAAIMTAAGPHGGGGSYAMSGLYPGGGGGMPPMPVQAVMQQQQQQLQAYPMQPQSMSIKKDRGGGGGGGNMNDTVTQQHQQQQSYYGNSSMASANLRRSNNNNNNSSQYGMYSDPMYAASGPVTSAAAAAPTVAGGGEYYLPQQQQGNWGIMPSYIQQSSAPTAPTSLPVADAAPHIAQTTTTAASPASAPTATATAAPAFTAASLRVRVQSRPAGVGAPGGTLQTQVLQYQPQPQQQPQAMYSALYDALPQQHQSSREGASSGSMSGGCPQQQTQQQMQQQPVSVVVNRRSHPSSSSGSGGGGGIPGDTATGYSVGGNGYNDYPCATATVAGNNYSSNSNRATHAELSGAEQTSAAGNYSYIPQQQGQQQQQLGNVGNVSPYISGGGGGTPTFKNPPSSTYSQQEQERQMYQGRHGNHISGTSSGNNNPYSQQLHQQQPLCQPAYSYEQAGAAVYVGSYNSFDASSKNSIPTSQLLYSRSQQQQQQQQRGGYPRAASGYGGGGASSQAAASEQFDSFYSNRSGGGGGGGGGYPQGPLSSGDVAEVVPTTATSAGARSPTTSVSGYSSLRADASTSSHSNRFAHNPYRQ